MEDEEEDRVLLSRLGVTSANPEDIERDIFTKAKNVAGHGNQSENSSEEQVLDEEHGADLSSTARTKLYNKLRAVEIEIDAVAASIEESKEVAKNESEGEGVDIKENEDAHFVNGCLHVTTDGLTLQQALATDRLRSLQKTKGQLQKEIARLDEDIPVERAEQFELLDKLVKEAPRQKHKKRDVQQSVVNPKKQKTVAYNEDADFDAVLDAASGGFVETEREELVRKGILTPFHRLKGFERGVQQSAQSSRQSVSAEETIEDLASSSITKVAQSMTEIARTRPTSKLLDAKDLPKLDGPTRPFQRLGTPTRYTGSKHAEDAEKKKQIRKLKRPLPEKKWRKSHEDNQMDVDDDARDESVASEHEEENQQVIEDATDEEPCVILEGGLKIPDAIFSKLFDYQKVGVQWLWELHCQRAGGIIGDEMGLGKTIQVIAFLSALHFSRMYKPSIVICPLTLLRQWQREARKWYPKFHVEILHDSAQSSRKEAHTKFSESDDESEASLCSDAEEKVHPVKSTRRWDNLINRVIGSESGLLLTTYEQLRILGDKLLDTEWGYAILDEGHRIRNPNAEVTLVCKQLQTVHRIIMTGAPIQNKLSELWSLFDFVFPGKLGVLPVFEVEFAVPITVGGYANATPLQVSTAYRCAVVLRDLIMPYLLRRMKADVNAQLPKKTEHVLFCSLTSDQRSIYRAFLASTEVEQIFDGNRNSLYGIDVMRKICNHPDLLEREHSAGHPDYGNPERSGKMKVVSQILTVWKEQGHHVLLFTQTQQMLDIIENFLSTSGYVYRRMDGLTPVKQRTALIDEFNNSTEVFIFILTTKVGGLGTNLTGANRVIIYDPDWNPSTDMQARERAWRIGQTRDVTVYRLITRGTIEEKVYHRQIYKHFLTNKILQNPQQRRFFKARDMRDLFTLQDEGETGSTETSNIFKELSEDVNVVCGNEQNNHEPQETNRAVKRTRSAVEKPKSGSKDKEKSDESSGKLDEDANILKSLFDAQGIHSAVNHDAIMNANDEDTRRMEQRASLVAQRAAEALRKSRMLRSRDSISVPTWTGRSGTAGAPSAVQKKFGSTVSPQLHGSSSSSLEGPSSRHSGVAVGMSTGKVLSSAELLARIRGTQEKAASEGLEHQLCQSSGSTPSTQTATTSGSSRPSNKHLPAQPEVLIRQLCTFIQQRGGSTESSFIVQNFKDKIPAKDLPLFRNLLKEIATLVKDSSGSRWVLKPDYR